VTNLFSQDTVTSIYAMETDTAAGIVLDEADFYAGKLDFQQLMTEQHVRKDPGFLKPWYFQAPRTARIMLRLMF